MDLAYFMLRYIPFWGVPLMIICAEFGYIFWLKSYLKVSITFACITAFCLVMTVFYYWVGGPDHAVKAFSNIIFSAKHY